MIYDAITIKSLAGKSLREAYEQGLNKGIGIACEKCEQRGFEKGRNALNKAWSGEIGSQLSAEFQCGHENATSACEQKCADKCLRAFAEGRASGIDDVIADFRVMTDDMNNPSDQRWMRLCVDRAEKDAAASSGSAEPLIPQTSEEVVRRRNETMRKERAYKIRLVNKKTKRRELKEAKGD